MTSALVLGLLFGIIFEISHIALDIYIIKKIKTKNEFIAKIKVVISFILTGFILFLLFSGFYVVKSNENVILTTFTGEQVVKDESGIKYSFLSSRESINVQKQLMKFPVSYSDEYELITLDEKPILINSFLEYKITDVHKWGVENKDSEQKLLVSLASNTKNIIQMKDYREIKGGLNALELDISEKMSNWGEVYGFEVINVNLQVSDTISVKQSKAQAESQKISSESLKESYFSEAEALKTKYNSLDDKEFIKYIEFIRAIKEGDVEMIITSPDLISPKLTLLTEGDSE